MSILSNSWKAFVLTSFIVASISAKDSFEWSETCRILYSASTFYLSILYNKIRFGKAFSFDAVMSGCCADQKDPKLCVSVDDAGKIISIHDGKKNQLLFGSVPRYKQHLEEIKKRANLSEKDKIGIYTLNRDFECDWSGLSGLQKTEPIIAHKYPTTDYTAPSLIDLIRVVRDLENRDESDEQIAYVHCKAGRGRSAATVSAYLMHVCNKFGIQATPQQIEEYLKKRRNSISINNEQRALLSKFAKELKEAGNFNELYAKYRTQAEQRDQEFAVK